MSSRFLFWEGDPKIRNPTIFNINSLGRSSLQPSIWYSKYHFDRLKIEQQVAGLDLRHSKLCKKLWKKIILGMSDAWSIWQSFHQPSVLYSRLSDYQGNYSNFKYPQIPTCSCIESLWVIHMIFPWSLLHKLNLLSHSMFIFHRSSGRDIWKLQIVKNFWFFLMLRFEKSGFMKDDMNRYWKTARPKYSIFKRHIPYLLIFWVL